MLLIHARKYFVLVLLFQPNDHTLALEICLSLSFNSIAILCSHPHATLSPSHVASILFCLAISASVHSHSAAHEPWSLAFLFPSSSRSMPTGL